MPLNILLRRLVDIALLRAGPQDLPYSTQLLGLCAAAAALATFLGMARFSADSGAILPVVVLIGFNFAFLYAVLNIRRLLPRLVQTATALFGVDTLITVLALPLIGMARPEGGSPLTTIAIAGLLIWNLAAVAHILRQALDTTMAAGVAVAMAYVLGGTFIVQTVAGA